MAFTSTPFLPPLNLLTPGSDAGSAPSAMATAASPAALPRARESFQTDTSLRAERNAVERRLVAVLAGDRHGAGEALRIERRDDAGGHAVILGDDRIDLVVGRGQALLHVLLGIVRLPAVGEGLADILDLAGVDRWP